MPSLRAVVKRIQMSLALNQSRRWLRPALLLFAVLPTLAAAEPLWVFTSVLPVKTFVERVGGPHVEARALVQPGYDPHTYEPTPQQIVALTKAVLYVRAGVPFEDAWMARIRSANPDMRVLEVGADARVQHVPAHPRDQPKAVDDHDPHDSAVDRHGHAHTDEVDPHVWTSPRRVRQMVGQIRDSLSALDPDNAEDYAARHDAFVAELDALDRDIHDLLDPLTHRRFMVFHPAWGHFAEAYGLVQALPEVPV